VHKKVRAVALCDDEPLPKKPPASTDPPSPPQESFVKLGFHLVLFFFYLYSMIVALIKDDTH
jgi:hypothetical protein